MGIQADVGEVARQPLKFIRFQAWVVRHWRTSVTVGTGASALLHTCRHQHFQTHSHSHSSSSSSSRLRPPSTAVGPQLVPSSSCNIPVLFSWYAGREDWRCSVVFLFVLLLQYLMLLLFSSWDTLLGSDAVNVFMPCRPHTHTHTCCSCYFSFAERDWHKHTLCCPWKFMELVCVCMCAFEREKFTRHVDLEVK